MSPSPIGTLALTTSSIDDYYSTKYKMNILSNQENPGFNFNSADLSFDADSPDFSQSPSNYSSQSSFTYSPKINNSVSKSIDIKNTKLNGTKNVVENSLLTPTANDLVLDSLNSTSFSFSFDKISNSSFMDYFNIPDSFSGSPSINCNFSINNDGIEFKENETGNGCLYGKPSNNDMITRKKRISFSSNNCLFPNFDDFDFNFDQCDSKNINNSSENIKFLDQYEDDKIKAEKLLDLSDLNVDDTNELNHIDNHDTLIAIRDMAIREKRSQQRKHKNSTSSVSSTSMSSRIKKFAIDLQNTTNNISMDNQNFKPVPIYTSSNSSNGNNNSKSSLKIEYFLNNLSDHEQAGLFSNELEIDRLNIDVDDTDLSQFLELEGWEQMLDEDCISRLTTDFSNQNFLVKKPNNKESNRNSIIYGSDSDNCNSEIQNKSIYDFNQTKAENVEIDNKKNNILKTSSTNSSINNQADTNSNLKVIPTNKISPSIKLPTRTVLNQSSSLSNLQSLSNTTKRSQPLVVVLSSGNSRIANRSSNSANSSKDIKSTNQLKQIIIENGKNKSTINNNSLNQALNITNNQIKKLNISEAFESKLENGSQEVSEALNNTTIRLNNSTDLKDKNNNINIESKIRNSRKDLDIGSTSSMSSSLIDPSIEVIDCINPDQIFPYRIVNKKDDLHFTEMNSMKNWTNTNTLLENNLKTENLEEEDDEEIDVVSINQNNSNLSLNNGSHIEMKTKNNLELKENSYLSISNKEFNNPNLSHHNYFHQPSTLVTQNNNIANKKTQMNFPNKNASQHRDQPSLLARCLKSPNIKNDANSVKEIASTISNTGPLTNKYNSNFTILGEKKQIFSNLTKTTNLNNCNNSFKSSDISNNLKNSFVHNSDTPISTISKSISSPILKKSQNLLMNTVNLDQSRKNSIVSSSNNHIVAPSTGTGNSLSARNLTQKNLANPIRILTTSINNSNSAIRQINQTTTLCNKQNIFGNTSINKGKSSNIIHIPTQPIYNSSNLLKNSVCNLSNVLTKNCKNTSKINNESKLVTTTLIAKPQMNKVVNTNLKKTNDKAKIISGAKVDKVNTDSNNDLQINSIETTFDRLSDFKQNLLESKSEISDEYDFNSGKKSYDFHRNDDEDNEITDDSVDDEDEDDDDDDDEESCNINSPLQISSNNLSPLSLTSSGQSNDSSSCSTPIKTKIHKAKNTNKLINELSDEKFDKIPISEKFRYKKKRKSKQLSQMTGLTSTSIKRNNRLNLLGYSSENPAEKRAFHILSERQRRNDLKKLFETLRTNIPNLCDKQKASKLTILKAAVDHLMEISNKKEKLNVIYDKEKQKNALLVQNLKNLQQSFNISSNHSNNCFSQTKTSSNIATLFVH